MERIYLDNAATTRVRPEAVQAALPIMTEIYGNPSSIHSFGREAKKALEKARCQVAAAIGAKKEEIYFTAGGSESDNWALKGVAHTLSSKGKHIITTAIEHHAILHTCAALEKEGFTVTYLPVDEYGRVTAEQVEKALTPETILVSVMMANNEIGTVQPITEIGALCRAHGVPFHTDAVQGFLKVPCAPAGWGVDLMSLSAHKIGGPKGIGALYVRPDLRNLRPLLAGGGQEEGLRSGTEATAQIAGFAKAVALRQEGLEEKLAHMARIKAYCRERLLSIPGVVPVGGGEAPHILAVSLVGYPSANVINDLGSQGICLSAGSACHRGKASRGYAALGLDKRTAAGVLRLSFGPETTEGDIDALYEALLRHKNTRFSML